MKLNKISSRILFVDIETFPMIGTFWQLHEAEILWVIRPTIICCFSAKWLGGKQITKALPDYKGYKQGKENDKKLIQDIWDLVDEADIVIGQNGDAFDIKMINTEFIKHGLPPPSPYKTVDTLKAAWKVFRFPSNKLDDLGNALEEGNKVDTGGKKLWKQCMENDPKAWAHMKKYNAQDVLLLEKVYLRFLPWIKSHPNVAVQHGSYLCPKCGSPNVIRSGIRYNTTTAYQQYQCKNCYSWSRDTSTIIKKEDKPFVGV